MKIKRLKSAASSLILAVLLGSSTIASAEEGDGSKAIINYLAEVAIRHYEREMENMLLPAPGSISAMETGILVKNYYYDGAAKLFVADAIKRGLPIEQPKDYGGKVQLFRMLKAYFEPVVSGDSETPDITKLDKINIATMMQNTTVTNEEVKSLLDILTNPFPTPLNLDALKAGDETYSIEDQQFLAKRAVQQAILSVALNAFGEIAAKRVPSSSQFADEGTELDSGDELLNTDPEETGASMIEALKSESEARFGNPQWYAELGRASTEAILRELAHMEAFRLWVEYLKYRQDEVMVSLMATMVAMNAEMAANMSTFSERMTETATRSKDISKELKDLDKNRSQLPEAP
ncbi:MAG: hypothetical protein U1E78_10650 [Gammaproteobacteria bacterium]